MGMSERRVEATDGFCASQRAARSRGAATLAVTNEYEMRSEEHISSSGSGRAPEVH